MKSETTTKRRPGRPPKQAAGQDDKHPETIPYRWKPGQSGNPTGKPSERRKVEAARIREMLEAVDPQTNRSEWEQIIAVTIRLAKQGSGDARDFLADRVIGKPVVQQINYNADVTKAERIAAMTDEELQLRLTELLTARNQSSGSVV